MSLGGLFPHICDVESKVDDKWGEPTKTVTTGVPCRWEHGNRKAIDFRGTEVLASATVFFFPDAAVTPACRLRESAADRWHAIVKIEKPSDLAAIHHLEVFVQ